MSLRLALDVRIVSSVGGWMSPGSFNERDVIFGGGYRNVLLLTAVYDSRPDDIDVSHLRKSRLAVP